MKVFLFYIGDEWLSTSSLKLKAVCTTEADVYGVVEDYLRREHGFKSVDEYEDEEDVDEKGLGEEDIDETIDDVLEGIEKSMQWLGRDFSVMIETIEANRIID